MDCSLLSFSPYVTVNTVAELHHDYVFFPTTEYATPAVLTQQRTPPPSRAVTPATTATAVDGGVGAGAMAHTPRKFLHPMHTQQWQHTSVYLTNTILFHCIAVE